MLSQFMWLALLSTLQPVRLHNTDETTMLQNIARDIISLHGLVVPLDIKFNQFREEVKNDIRTLRDSMNSLNHSISKLSTWTQTEMTSIKTSLNSTQVSIHNLTTCLQEHKQQTATELFHLQTSLTSTHSKLDTLTNTTASDHQHIIDSMTDVECLDTQQTVQLHQNMQDNLTQQLETIKDCIESLPVYTCGGTGGWKRVAYLDMTDPHTTCPSGWKLTGYSKRTCGRVSTGDNTCDSTTFPVSGGEYSRICGRIAAYQWGQPDAFANTGRSIDEAYACGVSVTHGTPRNHIWTFVAGTSESDYTYGNYYACPCDGGSYNNVPQFVGSDYFCESGVNEPWDISRHNYILYSNDTLWDGEDCLPSSTCCSLHNPPYFVKQLPTSTTDDIEARICVDDPIQWANIAVELVELYVQ